MRDSEGNEKKEWKTWSTDWDRGTSDGAWNIDNLKRNFNFHLIDSSSSLGHWQNSFTILRDPHNGEARSKAPAGTVKKDMAMVIAAINLMDNKKFRIQNKGNTGFTGEKGQHVTLSNWANGVCATGGTRSFNYGKTWGSNEGLERPEFKA